MQVSSGLSVSLHKSEERSIINTIGEVILEEDIWSRLDSDLYYWTQPLRPVQVVFFINAVKTYGYLQNLAVSRS